MMELFLIALPLPAALGIMLCSGRSVLIRSLLLATALLHLTGMGLLAFAPGWNVPLLPDWIGSDLLSKVVAGVASFLFFCVSIHAFFWLPMARKYETSHGKAMRENWFCAILCLFLSTMTLVAFSRNFGLLWVAVEATTLASAPLICFHRSTGSLEAMWKYLLICSAGIGLALFGTLLLGVAIRNPDGSSPGLGFAALLKAGETVHPEWFKAAFLFCFAGYGLKMGLAPFHTWLPDAHSEAPSMVSVLLSGSLLNCSFLALARLSAAAPPSLVRFCREYWIFFGLFSLLIAAFFLIRQRDYKRMLAYSSVEHMGLLALFWGLNSPGIGLIHLGMHSLCKMILFLTAGNVLLARGTRRIEDVCGLFGRMPLNATLWLGGILLICGMPPSPLFMTEFLLISRAGPWLGGGILLLLFAVFCGMTSIGMKMTMGADLSEPAPERDRAAERLGILPAVLTTLPLLAGMSLIFIFKGVVR